MNILSNAISQNAALLKKLVSKQSGRFRIQIRSKLVTLILFEKSASRFDLNLCRVNDCCGSNCPLIAVIIGTEITYNVLFVLLLSNGNEGDFLAPVDE